MLKYVSNKGGVPPVDFETAILDGFAADGGLYVPEQLPKISPQQLTAWKDLGYVDLAFEMLSLFIDRTTISAVELKDILHAAYAPFTTEAIIPLYPLQSRKEVYIMELFHGPTLSFKDVGLAFLVNLVNFFLKRKQEHQTLVVATTGDTGPAAAHFAAGKSNMDAWVLFPKDNITEEQRRQMTTLPHLNIHPVGVSNCPDGCDDLDLVIAKLYANQRFKEKLNLSSVNSINWGRVMMQMVHYFYGYLQVVDKVGDPLHIVVPSGAFGNLCAGGLARKMGLPVTTLVAANNQNACIHRIFSQGVFSKKALIATESSAIDILIPYNFWRYLYFCVAKDGAKIKTWLAEFATTGKVEFPAETFAEYSKGFLSCSSSDAATLATIKAIYDAENYVLDPHSAVAVTAAEQLKFQLGKGKIICLATAHASKFPASIKRALGSNELPLAAQHPSIEEAKRRCEKIYWCDYTHLEEALIQAMESNWALTQNVNPKIC